MSTAAAETTGRGRPAYLERMVAQTGLDRDALTVLYDEHGNRRRVEVLGGRLVEKPIVERSSRYQERTALLFHLKTSAMGGRRCPSASPASTWSPSSACGARPLRRTASEPAARVRFRRRSEVQRTTPPARAAVIAGGMPSAMRTRRALAVLAVLAMVVGAANLLWFIGEGAGLGGDALNGSRREGHCFVGGHGTFRQPAFREAGSGASVWGRACWG